MKKKFHLCHLFDKTHQKCWIVMKLYFIFTVCLVGTSFGNSLAQKATSDVESEKCQFI